MELWHPVIRNHNVSGICAHAVVLQLPLEGSLKGGGIAFVLKRAPTLAPTWLGKARDGDFYVSFQEVRPCQYIYQC